MPSGLLQKCNPNLLLKIFVLYVIATLSPVLIFSSFLNTKFPSSFMTTILCSGVPVISNPIEVFTVIVSDSPILYLADMWYGLYPNFGDILIMLFTFFTLSL